MTSPPRARRLVDRFLPSLSEPPHNGYYNPYGWLLAQRHQRNRTILFYIFYARWKAKLGPPGTLPRLVDSLPPDLRRPNDAFELVRVALLAAYPDLDPDLDPLHESTTS